MGFQGFSILYQILKLYIGMNSLLVLTNLATQKYALWWKHMYSIGMIYVTIFQSLNSSRELFRRSSIHSSIAPKKVTQSNPLNMVAPSSYVSPRPSIDDHITSSSPSSSSSNLANPLKLVSSAVAAAANSRFLSRESSSRTQLPNYQVAVQK